MSHVPQGKQSVPLEAFNGLITFADPQSLPERASPWSEDMSYQIGSAVTRAGLQSVYTFAGESLGPSGGGHAVNIPIGGSLWSNPTNILANDGTYTSVAIGGPGSAAAQAATG